jgi:hypothetical protein
MGKPVQAEEEMDRQIRPSIRSCDVERKKVVKRVSHVPRKAAIVYDVPVP